MKATDKPSVFLINEDRVMNWKPNGISRACPLKAKRRPRRIQLRRSLAVKCRSATLDACLSLYNCLCSSSSGSKSVLVLDQACKCVVRKFSARPKRMAGVGPDNYSST